MKVTILGAAQEVTGSCHLLETRGKRILLDCGLYQGGADSHERNAQSFSFDPKTIDAVVLSHAHIDHSGRLPHLVKRGFSGKIFAHRATRDLCRIMLRDSAFLQERGAAWENRKRQRKHLKLIQPLYNQKDVQICMRKFKAVDFDDWFEPVKGVRVRLRSAGHILGASFVEVSEEAGSAIIFSGDLGSYTAPLLEPPKASGACDLMLVESTYGNRLHRSMSETWKEIGEILSNADANRGNILIPAFAVGRTQQILHAFHSHFEEWGLNRWKVFLDRPLAIEACEIHDRHRSLLRQDIDLGPNLTSLKNLHISKTAKQSMALNNVKSGAIIVAGSGMCEGGRIRHHLKHNLWRDNCHVLIVGYQAGGTLGRRLVEGAKRVSIWGEAIQVGAKIHTIGGLSAHADQNDLIRWIQDAPGNPQVALVHGEPESQEGLQAALGDAGISNVIRPTLGEVITV